MSYIPVKFQRIHGNHTSKYFDVNHALSHNMTSCSRLEFCLVFSNLLPEMKSNGQEYHQKQDYECDGDDDLVLCGGSWYPVICFICPRDPVSSLGVKGCPRKTDDF